MNIENDFFWYSVHKNTQKYSNCRYYAKTSFIYKHSYICIHFTCLTEKCNGMAWRANRRYMLYNICIILFIDVRLSKIICFFSFLSLFVCSMIKEQTLNPFASIEPYIRFLKQAKDAFTLTIFTFLTKIPSKCTLILLALIFMFAQWECSRRVSSVLWSRLGNNVWYVLHENDKTWYFLFLIYF